ncbi:MAG: hypothetical protein ACXWU5_01935 [Rhodoplanes sp.]|jgi:hypothetical protein
MVMRVFFAFILGIVVTIGGAYVRDSTVTLPTQRFVNWEVVSESTRGAVDFGRAQWDRWTR